jgi:hypothetical protein
LIINPPQRVQVPSPTCEVERGRFSGLPFDSTGTLDGDHNVQQPAPHLTRNLPTPACRRTATAFLHREALAHQSSVTSAIIAKMIRSILASFFLSLIVWLA